MVASGKARDFFSLNAAARQIAASRAPHSAPASQASSSFVALRLSQASFTADLAGRAALRSHRSSPSPTRNHSSRSSNRVEPAGEALLQTLARFADQLAAQSAAQSAAQLSALSTIMQRFDMLHPTRTPSQAASPTSPHASHRQSALDARALACVPLSSCSQSIARPLSLNPRATAHVPLSAPQQAHQCATALRDASPVQLGAI